MIYKVGENLFVGNQDDFYDQLHCELFTENDAVILAGKVFHKQFARVQGCDEDGYVGNMDKNEPEYLAAYRDKPCDMLVLNLLDIDNAEYVSKDCVETAVRYATEKHEDGKRVIIFDTKCESMAPMISLLVLANLLTEDRNSISTGSKLHMTYDAFKWAIKRGISGFNPKSGIDDVARDVFHKIDYGRLYNGR